MKVRLKRVMSQPQNKRTRNKHPVGESFWESKDPITISRIEVQKKSKDRYSLYAGEKFLIGLSAESLIKSGIKRGDTLTSEKFQVLVELEQKDQIRNYLFRLLSRRDHSRFELRQKALKTYGYMNSASENSRHIEELLEELSIKGYLNEESFARKFITDKSTLSGWGPAKIRSALIRKEIPPLLIDSLLSELISDQQKLTTAQTLLLKKKWYFEKVSDQGKRKLKMQSFLAQRGFSYSVIDKAITLILHNQDVSKPDA